MMREPEFCQTMVVKYCKFIIRKKQVIWTILCIAKFNGSQKKGMTLLAKYPQMGKLRKFQGERCVSVDLPDRLDHLISKRCLTWTLSPTPIYNVSFRLQFWPLTDNSSRVNMFDSREPIVWLRTCVCNVRKTRVYITEILCIFSYMSANIYVSRNGAKDYNRTQKHAGQSTEWFYLCCHCWLWIWLSVTGK